MKKSESIHPVPAETSTCWADAFEAEIRQWRGVALSMDGVESGPRAAAERKRQKEHLAQLETAVQTAKAELDRARQALGAASEAGDEAVNAAFDEDIREGAIEPGGSAHCASWWPDACASFASAQVEQISERATYEKLTAADRQERQMWSTRRDLAHAESMKRFREKKVSPFSPRLLQ